MKNKTGSFIRITGIVLAALGLLIFLLGLAAAFSDSESHQATDMVVLWFALSGILSGLIFLGLGEAINLLQEIRNSTIITTKTSTGNLMNFKPTESPLKKDININLTQERPITEKDIENL